LSEEPLPLFSEPLPVCSSEGEARATGKSGEELFLNRKGRGRGRGGRAAAIDVDVVILGIPPPPLPLLAEDVEARAQVDARVEIRELCIVVVADCRKKDAAALAAFEAEGWDEEVVFSSSDGNSIFE
jgi:hypothetical protein